MTDRLAPEEHDITGADWYRTIVENVNDIVTVIDTDGTITYVSPAVTRVLGYDRDELVGHEGYEFVHPEDRTRNANAVAAVRSNPSGSETVEVRFRYADGSWRWIEATMSNRLDDDSVDGILLSVASSVNSLSSRNMYRKPSLLIDHASRRLHNDHDQR